MSWWYESSRLPSEKNGSISVRRVLGDWSVSVDGFDQSTAYIRKMWRRALKRVPRHASVKHVLLLGLGAGSIIDDLHRQFPGCQVIVIEWDPVMVSISERLRLYRPEHAPRMLLGDALDIVPTLTQAFDLIIFDLYRGKHPEPRLASVAFQQVLRERLGSDGYLLMNVFGAPALLDATDAHFKRERTWRFRYNLLALYRP